MMFIVIGPTNSKEQRMVLIEAPTIDAAALGAGAHLGIEVDGHAQIVDFRFADSSREYRYIRGTQNQGDYEFYKITPKVAVRVSGDGVILAGPGVECPQQ